MLGLGMGLGLRQRQKRVVLRLAPTRRNPKQKRELFVRNWLLPRHALQYLKEDSLDKYPLHNLL